MRTIGYLVILPTIFVCLYWSFNAANNLLHKWLMAREILSLLEPSPALGTQWPQIPGPRPADQVCVVGAGPAGVHMASELIRRNHTVVLLEKSNRIGGKSHDIDYRGVAQPQGTCFLEPNHFDNLLPLAEEFGVGEIEMIPSSPVWTTNSADDPGSKLSTTAYVLGVMAQFTNTTSEDQNLNFLFKKTLQYIKLHKEMFGSYTGDLMLRPNATVMARLEGTFLEFLIREDLHALEPIFVLSHTMQGYGQLDKVSSLYGLIWNNPRLLVAVTLNALQQDMTPYSIFILKHGFEKVWRTVVEQMNIDVEFNVDIRKVHRGNDGVRLQMIKNNSQEEVFCDWMVWTPPMPELLKVLDQPTAEEQALFHTLTSATFTNSIINIEGAARNGPYQGYMENLAGPENHTVTADLDLLGVKLPDIQTEEGLAKYNSDKGFQTRAVVQMGKDPTSKAELNQILIEHYTKGFNGSNIEILHTNSHTYFPRWSPEEMTAGRHWDVFGIQGTQRTWYSGSSVSFESIRSVMEYNKLLLRQMVTNNQHKLMGSTTECSTSPRSEL